LTESMRVFAILFRLVACSLCLLSGWIYNILLQCRFKSVCVVLVSPRCCFVRVYLRMYGLRLLRQSHVNKCIAVPSHVMYVCTIIKRMEYRETDRGDPQSSKSSKRQRTRPYRTRILDPVLVRESDPPLRRDLSNPGEDWE
jgi:hypothetical protein